MVGIPGAIDPRTGRVSLIPNIAGLEEFDVLGFLRGRFGPDVAIENDVNLAMLGEHALGCATHCRNAAFLSLGTGAGLGLLIEDKLFRGASGSAGEIADLPIGRDPASKIASAGGAFELEVGSLAIVDRYRRQGGTAAATVRDIFSLLEQGDEVAASVLDTTARWVALAVVTLQSLLDLELIVFGGSIGVRPELYERVATGSSRPLLTTHHHRTQPAWRSRGAHWRRVGCGAGAATELQARVVIAGACWPTGNLTQ